MSYFYLTLEDDLGQVVEVCLSIPYTQKDLITVGTAGLRVMGRQLCRKQLSLEQWDTYDKDQADLHGSDRYWSSTCRKYLPVRG